MKLYGSFDHLESFWQPASFTKRVNNCHMRRFSWEVSVLVLWQLSKDGHTINLVFMYRVHFFVYVNKNK